MCGETDGLSVLSVMSALFRRVVSGRALAAVAVTLGVGVALSCGSAEAQGAHGQAAYVLTDLQCDPHDNGVLDITLVNDDPTLVAHFTVATKATPSQVEVAPSSARALTMTDLADGPVVVPVLVNGVSTEVSATVRCDQPEVEVLDAPVPTAAPTTTAPAEAQSGGPAAVPTTVAAVSNTDAGGEPLLPSTGSSTGGLVVGGLLVAAGIAASFIARRRYS
jgi:LPXTG-motif cell wall-anchored protein